MKVTSTPVTELFHSYDYAREWLHVWTNINSFACEHVLTDAWKFRTEAVFSSSGNVRWNAKESRL